MNITLQKNLSTEEGCETGAYSHGYCPFCDNEAELTGDDGDPECFYRFYTCDTCGMEWTEVYPMRSIFITQAQKD